MRKLTITRRKRFIAALGKYKVYVEDASSDEIVINGVACRKLGALKNGDTQTYDIGEEALKVFVIADKLSKDFCNDFYEIPAGSEDVTLFGSSTCSPGLGNPFRFENNDSVAAKKSHKNKLVISVIVFVAVVAVGAVIGYAVGRGMFGSKPERLKNFTYEDMTITLTDAFKANTHENFKACYSSKDVAVYVLEEDVSPYPNLLELSEAEYAELMIGSDQSKVFSSVKTHGGITYFEYNSEVSAQNRTYHYVAFIFKHDTSFWVIQFATAESDHEKNKGKIFEWAESIRFNK